jgi:hypothetical protein
MVGLFFLAVFANFAAASKIAKSVSFPVFDDRRERLESKGLSKKGNRNHPRLEDLCIEVMVPDSLALESEF